MIIKGFDAARFAELEHTIQFFKKEIFEKVEKVEKYFSQFIHRVHFVLIQYFHTTCFNMIFFLALPLWKGFVFFL